MQAAFTLANSSIRFINVKEYFKDRSLVTPAHFTVEIYFRLVMPDVLKKYDKVIYFYFIARFVFEEIEKNVI